jgi:hypothetical protein
MSFDLVTPTLKGRGPTPQQIATRLSDCADRFLGAALHDSASIDPDIAFGEASGPDLMRLAAAQLRASDPVPAAWTPARSVAAPSSTLSA